MTVARRYLLQHFTRGSKRMVGMVSVAVAVAVAVAAPYD
jgi:hypothetical protein